MGTVFEVSDGNFDQEVKRSTLPVLVFFYSPQCGYCKNQNPVFDDFAKDKSSKAKFVKLDISKNPQKASEYKVNGVPHFVLFKDGKAVISFGGFHHKFQLSDRLAMYGL